MSFRRFVIWCALCGGWAAAFGWAAAWLVVRNDALAGTGLHGMFLGMSIALALGLVDACWVFSLRQFRRVLPRILVCVLVGAVGGLAASVAGQLLFDWENLVALQVLGWVLTGLMVGISIGIYDLVRGWVRVEDLRGAARKVLRGILGGAVGGLLGGFLDYRLFTAWTDFFPGRSDLWSPSLTGFVVLGLCIGLFIAVAQVVLQEAWLKVEAGFRPGREVLLSRPVLTIGRAESCDLGLFGDPKIDKLHARIWRQQDGNFLISDAGSATGTFVNNQRVQEPVLLRSGDLIRVGNAYLRFRARNKD